MTARHVHLVEGGEHGGGVLRLLQPLGDALAAGASCARAPRALPPAGRSQAQRAGAARDGAAGVGARRGLSSCRAPAGRPDVALGQRGRPCRWPRPAAGSSLFSVDQLAHRPGRAAAPLTAAAAGCRRRAAAGAAWLRRLAAAAAAARGAFGDRAEHGADLDGVCRASTAISLSVPAAGAIDLERHLVGLRARPAARRP